MRPALFDGGYAFSGLTSGTYIVEVGQHTVYDVGRTQDKNVDFGDPVFTGVNEIVVTGPSGPKLTSLDDLAGKKVHVRKSSSYYESLLRLNKSLKNAGKKPVKLVAADELLEDSDLLEMVNAGLIPAVVVDSQKAEFWGDIFERHNVQVFMNGHDHHYHHALKNNVHYITSAGGGAPLYNFDSPQPETVKSSKVEHFVNQ